MSRHFFLTADNSAGKPLEELLKRYHDVMRNRAKLFAYYLDGRRSLETLVTFHNDMHALLEDVMNLRNDEQLAPEVVRIIEDNFNLDNKIKEHGLSTVSKSLAKKKLGLKIAGEDGDSDDYRSAFEGIFYDNSNSKHVRKLTKRAQDRNENENSTDTSDLMLEPESFRSRALRAKKLVLLQLSDKKFAALSEFTSLETAYESFRDPEAVIDESIRIFSSLKNTLTPLEKLKLMIRMFFESEAKMAELAQTRFNTIMAWIQARSRFSFSKSEADYLSEIGSFFEKLGMHALSKVFLVAVPKIKELKKAIKAIKKCNDDSKQINKKDLALKVIPLVINIYEPLQQIAEAFSENSINDASHSRAHQTDSDSSDSDSSDSNSDYHSESAEKILLSRLFKHSSEQGAINLKRVVTPDWQNTVQALGSAILFHNVRDIRDKVAREIYSILDTMRSIFEGIGYEKMLSALQWNEEQTRRYCSLLRLDTDRALGIVYAKTQQALAEKMPHEITELKALVTAQSQEITELKTAVAQMADLIRTMQAQQQTFLDAVMAEKVGQNTTNTPQSQSPSLFKR